MKNKLASITAQHLHISYSQVWTYLNCSLKYYFNYVLGLPRERTSIALGGVEIYPGHYRFFIKDIKERLNNARTNNKT